MSKLPNDFMSVREACEAMPTMLRSESTLRALIHRNAVRCWKVGGRVLLSRRELVEDLEACRVERATSKAAPVVLGAQGHKFHNKHLQAMVAELNR